MVRQHCQLPLQGLCIVCYSLTWELVGHASLIASNEEPINRKPCSLLLQTGCWSFFFFNLLWPFLLVFNLHEFILVIPGLGVVLCEIGLGLKTTFGRARPVIDHIFLLVLVPVSDKEDSGIYFKTSQDHNCRDNTELFNTPVKFTSAMFFNYFIKTFFMVQ